VERRWDLLQLAEVHQVLCLLVELDNLVECQDNQDNLVFRDNQDNLEFRDSRALHNLVQLSQDNQAFQDNQVFQDSLVECQDNLERCQDNQDKLVLFHHQLVEFNFKMITSHLLAQHLGRHLLEQQMITSHLLVA
jgi:neutral trehalase